MFHGLGSCVAHVKAEDIYKDIAKDVTKCLILQTISQKELFQNKKAKNNWFTER